VEYKPGSRKLLVYIDADGPLTIEQCRLFNRYLSEKLDEIDFGDEKYTLEVSSPGADRPLLNPRQYNKHTGREFKIILKTNTELIGKLTQVNNQEITVLLKDKKKGYNSKEPSEKKINFNDILQATVIINFN